MSPRGGLAGEAARKLVHISMGGFAFALRWLSPLQAMLAAIVALLFNLFVLHRLTRRALLREGERGRGFSWGIVLYPAVVLALVIVFRQRLELAAAAWALLAFGDGMATVAGLWLKGPRLPWNPGKTWSGWAAFVLYGTAASALLIRWTQTAVIDATEAGRPAADWIGSSFLGLGVGAPISEGALLVAGCLVAALAAAFAESLDTGIDDNLLVPLVGGATLWLATLVDPLLLAADAGLLGAQLLMGVAVNGILAVAAYAARGVSVSGAVWGFVLGTMLYGFGDWEGFLMLLVFFVLGTGTTKLGYARKAALGIAQEKGGRRGARNAFANTGAGVVCAFLAVATPYRDAFAIAMVAAFATAACDTVSSEVGQAYGKRHYLVTNLRRVRAGTDGAVSVEGTLGGILGAAALALVAWAVGLVGPSGAAIVVAAAFFGATLESYLGATVEGVKRIDNELVNFANTVAGAVAAGGLYLLMAGTS